MSEKDKKIFRSNKEIAKELNNRYFEELEKAHRNKECSIPLYLYSKRVYRAYCNAWYVIDRKLLTPDEIHIMKELGIYKLSRTERGIPRHLSQSRINAFSNRMSKV